MHHPASLEVDVLDGYVFSVFSKPCSSIYLHDIQDGGRSSGPHKQNPARCFKPNLVPDLQQTAH